MRQALKRNLKKRYETGENNFFCHLQNQMEKLEKYFHGECWALKGLHFHFLAICFFIASYYPPCLLHFFLFVLRFWHSLCCTSLCFIMKTPYIVSFFYPINQSQVRFFRCTRWKYQDLTSLTHMHVFVFFCRWQSMSACKNSKGFSLALPQHAAKLTSIAHLRYSD